jgi:hypothetical protein
MMDPDPDPGGKKNLQIRIHDTVPKDVFLYFVQHCFICHPSDSILSEDAGIAPRAVASLALSVRRSNHSAIDLIHSNDAW